LSGISDVERDVRLSQDEAGAKKLDTAELASKAAIHSEHCSSILRSVSSAHSKTHTSLITTNTRIARAQQEINDNEKLSAEMALKAKQYDEKAEDNNTVCALACLIR
jgi:hypothetical protein